MLWEITEFFFSTFSSQDARLLVEACPTRLFVSACKSERRVIQNRVWDEFCGEAAVGKRNEQVIYGL